MEVKYSEFVAYKLYFLEFIPVIKIMWNSTEITVNPSDQYKEVWVMTH